VTNGRQVLSEFAAEFTFCAICWSRRGLHIHHLQQGAGRSHVRENLLRLCWQCHERVHSGGSLPVTKGMCLTAKRESDDAFYDPALLAALRHKRHLGYGPDRLPPWVVRERERNGMPQELTDMPINSRRKGKVGELEARDRWNSLLPRANARRAQQHSGSESASDLISPGTPNLWLEVKRVQALNIHATMAKSLEQCGSLAPVILHRKNDTEWLLTIRLDDVREFATQVLGAQ
jgi:hypothetical protein